MRFDEDQLRKLQRVSDALYGAATILEELYLDTDADREVQMWLDEVHAATNEAGILFNKGGRFSPSKPEEDE